MARKKKLLICGQPGIGKSDLVRSIAKERGWAYRVHHLRDWDYTIPIELQCAAMKWILAKARQNAYAPITTA